MDETRSIGLTGSWDTRISRRTLLRTGGTAAVSLVWLSRAATARAHPPYIPEVFSLGVASGDPTPDGIVLWTRLCPDPLNGGGLDEEPYGVRYEIAADPDFNTIVQRGTANAVPEEALSVHAEVTGLEPATWYWYRFAWGRVVSRIGRTRTAPPYGSSPERIRFAFVSCQNYSQGYFPAYADLARQEDIELVVHLGDYIYEGTGVGPIAIRPHARGPRSRRSTPTARATRSTRPTRTCRTRTRRSRGCSPGTTTRWPTTTPTCTSASCRRRWWPRAGRRPMRPTGSTSRWPAQRKPLGKDMSMYRREPWGDLATFHVLDTRQYRDVQPIACLPAERDPSPPIARISSTRRRRSWAARSATGC